MLIDLVYAQFSSTGNKKTLLAKRKDDYKDGAEYFDYLLQMSKSLAGLVFFGLSLNQAVCMPICTIYTMQTVYFFTILY